MLNQNQTQNQSSFQQYQQDQPRNPYPKSQRKDSNSNNPMNSKFSQNKPYQSHHELQNNSSNREPRDLVILVQDNLIIITLKVIPAKIIIIITETINHIIIVRIMKDNLI